MGTEEFYKFPAFISYSSSDSKFARRLHRSLERYRVPVSSKSTVNLDATHRLRPIFLDSQELSSGVLSERLQSALESSNSLIVVCSPSSAKSDWVSKEIDYFCRLGRRDRIFAIIKDGIPNAPDHQKELECLPEALRSLNDSSAEDNQILAADARKRLSFRKAWLSVLSGILGVNLGSLLIRDRSRTLAVFSLFTIVSILLLSI